MKFLKLSIENKPRVYGLDIFRAIAILIVVKEHGRIVSGDLFELIPSIPLIDGVELFFVLSGFLIGSILIKIIERENKINLLVLSSFW